MRSGGSGRSTSLAISACLVLGTLAAYAEVRHHDFVEFDDLLYVVLNPNLQREISASSLLEHFRRPYMGNWLPLYWISLHVGRAVHGLDAGAFLLTNVVIHAFSSVLLFLALARMTGARWCSAFVAAVFALHPLHVESVAWVSERKDVLSGLFWMLGLLAYARYAEQPGSRGRYVAVLLCLVLGLLCKSTGVTFPFVLLLLDYWPLGRLRGSLRSLLAERSVLGEKVPLFAVTIVAIGATYASQRAHGNMMVGERIGLVARLANAAESYWLYLGDFFWPAGLAAVYPHPYALSPPAARDLLVAAGLGLALLACTVLVLRQARARPHLLVGWLWYLGTLVPMIGLVHVGLMARADRYMYLPLVGPAIALAWLGAEAASRSRGARHAVAAAGVASLIAMFGVTRVQVGYWRDTITLFERAAAAVEDSRFAHEKLAMQLSRAGRHAEAIPHFEEALRIEPDRMPSRDGLAAAQLRLGDIDAAIRVYERDVRLHPERRRSHGALGLMLVRVGRHREATAHLHAAIEAYPEPAYQAALADAELALGERRRALDHYRLALRAEPDRPNALRGAAWILATSAEDALRDPAEAIRIAQTGTERIGEDAALLDAWAAALASEGRYEEALAMAARAAARADASGDPRRAGAIRDRSDLYRMLQPYRE